MSAPPVKKCPNCGKSKVKRLLGTGAGIIFKGSGFYTTDYRDASYKEKAKAESGATGGGGDSGKSSDGQAESKPAAESKPSEPKPSESKSTASSDKPAAAPKSGPKGEKKSKK